MQNLVVASLLYMLNGETPLSSVPSMQFTWHLNRIFQSISNIIIIIIIIEIYNCMQIIIITQSFSHQRKQMVFHWRLGDSKSPQVSRTLLSILAVFNNAVDWMVFTRPPTSKSSRSFNKLLVPVPKAPFTIGIIVTFIFHSFFNSLARSRYLSLFSHSFSFIL